MQTLPIAIIEQHLPETISILKDLVTIESPSTDKAAVDRVGARVIEELEDLNGHIEVFPEDQAGNNILCRWGTGPGGLMVMMHMDTVFDLGTLATMPFRETPEKIYGPGVMDMKAGIAMLLSNLRLFRVKGVWPSHPITALFTSDEETGSLTSRALIEAEAQKADMVFCLEPGMSNGAIKTARKGTGDIELRARGIAAHAGADHEKGRNAIEELAHHILAAQQLTDYSEGTTVNVGIVKGGTRTNVVPEEAEAFIDFRVANMAAYERLEAWVKNLKPVIPGAAILGSILLNRPPMPRDALMAQTFQKAQTIANEIGLTLIEGSTGGCSDANFVAPLGTPVLDGLGPIGDGAHSDREFFYVDTLKERTALLANLLLNW